MNQLLVSMNENSMNLRNSSPSFAKRSPITPIPFFRNGTFMAYRKLHENVWSWNAFIDKAAALGFQGVLIGGKRPHLSLLQAGEAERAALGIPALPLSAQQTADLIELLKAPPAGEEKTLVELITYRVPAGVDDAAKVKASYLAAVATAAR